MSVFVWTSRPISVIALYDREYDDRYHGDRCSRYRIQDTPGSYSIVQQVFYLKHYLSCTWIDLFALHYFIKSSSSLILYWRRCLELCWNAALQYLAIMHGHYRPRKVIRSSGILFWRFCFLQQKTSRELSDREKYWRRGVRQSQGRTTRYNGRKGNLYFDKNIIDIYSLSDATVSCSKYTTVNFSRSMLLPNASCSMLLLFKAMIICVMQLLGVE